MVTAHDRDEVRGQAGSCFALSVGIRDHVVYARQRQLTGVRLQPLDDLDRPLWIFEFDDETLTFEIAVLLCDPYRQVEGPFESEHRQRLQRPLALRKSRTVERDDQQAHSP